MRIFFIIILCTATINPSYAHSVGELWQQAGKVNGAQMIIRATLKKCSVTASGAYENKK